MFRLDVVLVASVAALLPVCIGRPWIGVLVVLQEGALGADGTSCARADKRLIGAALCCARATVRST
jgi:hypothetical protein